MKQDIMLLLVLMITLMAMFVIVDSRGDNKVFNDSTYVEFNVTTGKFERKEFYHADLRDQR